MAEPAASTNTYPAAIAWGGGLVFGLGSGCAAAMLQRWFAPVVVFPLTVGVITGLATGGVWAGRGGGSKRAVIISATIAALVCFLTWHFASYLIARRDAEAEQRKVHEAMSQLMPDPSFSPTPERPTGFQAYLGVLWHGGRQLGARRITRWWLAAWWFADAVLVMMGAVVAAVAVGRPYASPRGGVADGASHEAASDDENSRRPGAAS